MYIQSYAPFLYFLFLSSNYKSVQNNKKVPFKKKKKKKKKKRREEERGFKHHKIKIYTVI